MRPLILLVLILGCAQTAAKPAEPEIGANCPAAVEAEKARAAREGRAPVPVVQLGRRITDLRDPRNRPAVTFAMASEANSAKLTMLAHIFVRSDGTVGSVEVARGSGSRSFDRAVAEKMKTWTHRPMAIDCRPVPYKYPMNWEHRFAP